MFTLFFLHCVEELLSSFKVRTSRHVQELEKCLSSLGGSVAFFFVCLFSLCSSRRRTCAKARELQSVLLQVLESSLILSIGNSYDTRCFEVCGRNWKGKKQVCLVSLKYKYFC